jgi:hypothetical protein
MYEIIHPMECFGNVQLGALIGSIIAYLLIETFSLLRERSPCEQIIC